MKWRLMWIDEAVDALAEVYLNAADGESISAANDLAEKWLQSDPHRVCSELHEGLFALDIEGLRIYLEIDDQRLEVRVRYVAAKNR